MKVLVSSLVLGAIFLGLAAKTCFITPSTVRRAMPHIQLDQVQVAEFITSFNGVR